MPSRRRFILATGSITSIGVTAGCIGGPSIATPKPPDGGVSDLPQPIRGPKSAEITVDVFSDFACPHCKDYHETVEPMIVNEYIDTGNVQLRHFDYPIPVSSISWPAAMAARAVQDLATLDAFWSYRSRLFENQKQLSTSKLQSLAAEVDVDTETVAARVSDSVYQPVVAKDRKEGQSRNVEGTPTTFVNGGMTVPSDGESYKAVVADAIEAEL